MVHSTSSIECNHDWLDFIVQLLNTVNQFLFVTTLFCNIMESHWFAASNFHAQDVDYPKTNTCMALRTGSQ